MEILVLGATGRTGRHLVRLILNEGHQVTAFVRSPEKLPRPQTGVRVIRGDGIDISNLQNLFGNQRFDAVIIAVGADSLKCSTVRGDVTKNVVKCLSQTNANPRIWVVSSAGANESLGHLGFFSRTFVNTILKGHISDHEAQENYVRESSLPYTIVRPVGLTDEMMNQKNYLVMESGRVQTTNISRLSVADFIVQNLDNPKYLGKAVTLCSSSEKNK
ncbi:NAD(P)-dependent oxidoreductase [Galbibacter mesophilus]|uniref:NAD(P)-dependent oxidoreductase n=1 Tax=Galbibacter mesophilus TaxID=379069 RepID=UPI00191D4AD7|nr:NAD(P)-binding oxidoreductase [Galbibacter mesophilus]MCM5661591.1 SDR family oxidoreductase [Galbibacter mesophilus]